MECFVVKPVGQNHSTQFRVSRHHPWNAIPVLDVSARPPPANPVPASPIQKEISSVKSKGLTARPTFPFQLNDVFLFHLLITHNALHCRPNESVRARLACDVCAWFAYCGLKQMIFWVNWSEGYYAAKNGWKKPTEEHNAV